MNINSGHEMERFFLKFLSNWETEVCSGELGMSTQILVFIYQRIAMLRNTLLAWDFLSSQYISVFFP